MLVHIGFFKDDTEHRINVVVHYGNRLVTLMNEESNRPVKMIPSDNVTEIGKKAIANIAGLFLVSYKELYLVTPNPTYCIEKQDLNANEKNVLIHMYISFQPMNGTWVHTLGDVLRTFKFIKKLEDDING